MKNENQSDMKIPQPRLGSPEAKDFFTLKHMARRLPVWYNLSTHRGFLPGKNHKELELKRKKPKEPTNEVKGGNGHVIPEH